MTAELSSTEGKNLEEYIHAEEDLTPQLKPPRVVFRALKKVGHLHHFRQQEYDNRVQNYRGDEALIDRPSSKEASKGNKRASRVSPAREESRSSDLSIQNLANLRMP